jgi:hypothetical protein
VPENEESLFKQLMSAFNIVLLTLIFGVALMFGIGGIVYVYHSCR